MYELTADGRAYPLQSLPFDAAALEARTAALYGRPGCDRCRQAVLTFYLARLRACVEARTPPDAELLALFPILRDKRLTIERKE